MKLSKKYKPELCVSPDTTRLNIAHCNIDAEGKIVATNGQVMVVCPVELSKDTEGKVIDALGNLAADTVKVARKASGKNDIQLTLCEKEVALSNGVKMPRAENIGPNFPPWRQVLPSYKAGDEGTITIGISADLLITLAKALGENKGNTPHEVTLTFPSPGLADRYADLDPIVVQAVKADEAIGVIMPVRVKDYNYYQAQRKKRGKTF